MKTFTLLLWIICTVHGNPMDRQWNGTCPMECQCSFTNLSQTMFHPWQYEQGLIASAMCVFQDDNIQNMNQLSWDLDALTFLQAHGQLSLKLNRYIMNSVIQLKILDVQGPPKGNKLGITEDVFQDMHLLKFLSLMRVDLIKVEHALANLHSLEILKITQCNIDILQWEMFNGLSALKELHLIGNGIKKINDYAFYGAPNVKTIILSHNDIFTTEADSLAGLVHLEHLDLSNNRFDHLSNLMFPPLPNLQTLELKHNPIRVIFSHSFRHLNRTEHLSLGHKKQGVQLMKFSFRGLVSLKFLHIPNIENDVLVEHMFYGLGSLLHLNLQGNIQIIHSRAFTGPHTTLTKLILPKCNLEKIMDDAFHGLHHLQTLDLSSNSLHHLPERVFTPLESVVEIILNNNKFKSLPTEIFLGLHQIQSLRLDGNPWYCDCNMGLWNETIVTNIIATPIVSCNTTVIPCDTPISGIIPLCEEPFIFKGQSVFKLLKTQLDCDV